VFIIIIIIKLHFCVNCKWLDLWLSFTMNSLSMFIVIKLYFSVRCKLFVLRLSYVLRTIEFVYIHKQ